MADVEQGGDDRVTACLFDDPVTASTRMIMRLALLAPVTMLRVYWICPGASAIINFRLGVEKYL